MEVKIDKTLLAQAERVSAEDYRKLPAPKAFENAFMNYHFDARIRHFKITTYLGLFLYGLYGIGDLMNFGDEVYKTLIIRYLIVIPAAIIALKIFKHKRFQKIQDLLLAISAVAISISIFSIKYHAHSQGLVYYSAGFLITIAYYNIVIQPKFWYSFASSIIVYFSGLSFYYYLGTPERQYGYIIFDSTTIIFLSLLSNYFIQLQVRKTFARKILADKAKEKEKLAQARLVEISNQDPLTGLPNRRFFDQNKHIFNKTGNGILFIDIDYFKAFNDTYGHLDGDECLKQVASSIQANVRQGDLCARYGGEEFVILMSDTNLKSIKAVALRIIEQIQALKIPHQTSPFGCVTASIGWCLLEADEDLEACLLKADEALYAAKEQGRNRLCP